MRGAHEASASVNVDPTRYSFDVETVTQEIETPPQPLADLLDLRDVALGIRLAELHQELRRVRDELVVAVVFEPPDLGAGLRVLRHQPGRGVFVLQVLVDDGRVADDLVLVDQHRDLAQRVQPEELRGALLLLAQVDERRLVLELFLGQDNPYLLTYGQSG